MGDRRIALVCGSALLASVAAVRASLAQPEGGGDVEMGDGSGSAAGSDASAPAKDPRLARKLFAAAQGFERKADQLARQNKTDDAKAQYAEAINAYQKAIEVGDDPSYTLALATAEDKSGDPASAYKDVKALLATQPPLKADVQKKAQAKLDDLDGKVGKVTLTITPDGTQIMIGGKTVGESPLTEPLVLSPGTYTVSFAAVGYEPKDTEIRPEAGSESERKIQLSPVKLVAKQPEAAEPAPEAPVVATKPKMIPLYAGGGAAAVLLTVSIVYDFKAKHQHDVFTAAKTTTTDRLDARDNGKLFAHVADITLIGAVGAAAFTGYWYWFKVRPATATQEKEHEPKVGIAPWVQPDASGLTAFGSF